MKRLFIAQVFVLCAANGPAGATVPRLSATGDCRLPENAVVVADSPGYNSWPMIQAMGRQPFDAGNVKATRLGGSDYCAWYTGTPSNATVVVTATAAGL